MVDGGVDFAVLTGESALPEKRVGDEPGGKLHRVVTPTANQRPFSSGTPFCSSHVF